MLVELIIKLLIKNNYDVFKVDRILKKKGIKVSIKTTNTIKNIITSYSFLKEIYNDDSYESILNSIIFDLFYNYLNSDLKDKIKISNTINNLIKTLKELENTNIKSQDIKIIFERFEEDELISTESGFNKKSDERIYEN